jgi:hypothetical protein
MAIGKIRQKLARGERLQIMLSPDELAAVDDFRFRHRMPSRAAAVRELFRLGLLATQSTRETDGKKSADFGVLSASKDSQPST